MARVIGEPLVSELVRFVGGSVTSLTQLLIASAEKATFNRIINCPTYPVAARTSDISEAVSLFKASMSARGVYRSNLLARLYSASCSLDHRKRTGQFFTPASLAEWALSVATPSRSEVICDAGCGAAVFAEALINCGFEAVSYVGIENDPLLALCAAHALEASGAPAAFKVWYTNFLMVKRADFKVRGLPSPSYLLSNPPFVRFHNLRGRERMLKDFRNSLGIKLSSFSGAGGYFLCRGAQLLQNAGCPPNSPGGCRMVVFTPSEAAGSAHWRQLREDLRREQEWQWRNLAIPADQTNGGNHSALALMFIFERTGKMKQHPPDQSRHGSVLGDVIAVKRGISTGCNEFFVLTNDDARARGIPSRRLRPILPTRIPIGGSSFTEANWDTLRLAGHKCWLLALPNVKMEELETTVQIYLKEGLRQGLNQTPTAQRLRTWYSLPIPATPPDVFITYLFRGAPRFVLNGACVLHLTNILGGRFTHPIEKQKDREAIVESLNVAAKGWIDQGAGREYRDGLRKIEPRELQGLPVDFSALDSLRAEWERSQPEPPGLFD